MEFIETSFFTKALMKAFSDSEYTEFQEALVINPELGKIIRGSGGLRKVRWNLENKGKSGGVRIVYYLKTNENRIYLLLLYPKNVQDTLTPDQLKMLKKYVEAI